MHKVLIIDYRAYKSSEPYSRALQVLANQEGVEYFAVAHQSETAFENMTELDKYPTLTNRVLRRWGAQLLRQKPYLWYYAEFYPEHLNEVGVKWLADQVTPLLKRPEKMNK